MRTIIIVRHGNTFRKGEISTRVGRKTDLPLVEEHRARSAGRYLAEQGVQPDRLYAAPLQRTTKTTELIAQQMGLRMEVVPEERFSEIDYGPDENKTEREVELRLGRIEMGRESDSIGEKRENPCVSAEKKECRIVTNSIGAPDKNVDAGEEIERCNRDRESVEQELIIELGRRVIEQWDSNAVVPDGWSVDTKAIIEAWSEFADGVAEGETVLICSSNGVIRFAPHILNGDYKEFSLNHNIKVATGSVSIFIDRGEGWLCSEWDTKPYEIYRER